MRRIIPNFALFLEILRLATPTVAQLMYSITEEQPGQSIVGNIVKDLQAVVGNDTLPSNEKEIRLSIHPGPFRDLFRVDEASGFLKTLGPIDRERVCVDRRDRCSMEVKVAVVQPVENFRVLSVLVFVDDINDHPPLFDRQRIVVSILESARPTLSAYPLPAAKDPDWKKHRCG